MEIAVSVLVSLAASGALTTVLVFIAKTWISERVKNAIQHEYDHRLETLKASIAAEQAVQAAATTTFRATHRVAFERRLDAISIVWKATMQIRQNTPAVLLIADHMNGAQYAKFIEIGRSKEQILSQVAFETLTEKFNPIFEEANDARPFAGEYFYALFAAYRSLVTLTASFMNTDFAGGSGQPWHEGNKLDYLLKSFMTDEEFADFQTQTFKLEWCRNVIERKMVAYASMVISGQESGDLAFSQARQIEEAALKVEAEARQKNAEMT